MQAANVKKKEFSEKSWQWKGAILLRDRKTTGIARRIPGMIIDTATICPPSPSSTHIMISLLPDRHFPASPPFVRCAGYSVNPVKKLFHFEPLRSKMEQ
jgi:hypothetical protein